MTLPWAAVPPLISALFLASLGVVALASGPPRRLWGSFAAFCLLMALAATCGFFAILQPDALARTYLMRGAIAAGSTSAVYGVFYAFVLTGERFPARFFGVHISTRAALIAGLVYTAVLPPLLVLTPWFLRGVERSADGRMLPLQGPAFYAVAVFVAGALFKIVFFLHQAHKESDDPAYRSFVKLNSRGFRSVFGPALILLMVLPIFGYNLQPLAFVGFPIAVTVFYIAIVRYQIAQVRQANEGLEDKVRKRTRALEQAQTRLVQAEKMASLGQLVAGVAHEVNNPLGALRSTQATLEKAAERLRSELEREAPALVDNRRIRMALRVFGEAGEVLGNGTRRIGSVVDQLRAFARLDEADLQRTQLTAGLEATLSLLTPRLERNRIEVQRDYGDLPELLCYPRQLNQVFMQLLGNAIDAIKTRGGVGRIELTTSSAGEGVQLRLRDDGVGIAASERERIFDPGYTKKGVGVGTGLGLAICQQIIERDHGGTIRVESEPGAGATFTIDLPLAPPKPAEDAAK